MGMLVKSSWSQFWSGEIVNIETEDIMWVKVLSDQVQQYQVEGKVVVCGDFNTRCGGLKDVDDDMNIVMGDRKC